MDSVAATTNTSKESTTHVSPQYDSSEEWEIGLGNLIIDLDADLEKDRQDGTGSGNTGGGAPADASPLRIGKMKIKRKVSTSTAGQKPEGVSPRKDNSLLSTEENSTAVSPTQIDRMSKEEKVSLKSGGRNLNSSSSGNISGTKHDPVVTPTGKQSVSTTGNTKVGSLTDMHGKYSGNIQPDNKDSMDNNICRIKPSTVDLKSQTVTVKKEKETTGGGGRKKEEKEGKDTMGKKGGDGSAKKHGGKKRGDKASSNTVGVGTSDAGTITEPEYMGPCEPGTSVNLEGIVWHETDQGVLVVNVTWRNKTYVGTLLDCSRHDWAPPRFCDSPTSDIENRNTKACGRPKRGRASNNSNNNNDMSNFTETRSSIHSKLRNGATVKGRKGTGANGNRTNAANEKQQNKRKHRPAEVSASSGDDSKSAKRLKSSANKTPKEPEPVPDPITGLFECQELNCNKKYKHVNGLRYHQQHAHAEKPDDDEEEEDDSENKSSSDESNSSAESVKSDESNRTKETETKGPLPAEVQIDSAEKRQLQYSTAAAQAAANAAAAAANAAAAASLEAKKLAADKTSPKLLGKSKESTPVKAKGDLADKNGKMKKGSSEKDLSVFDFNSAVDSDSSDKHVSVIRPTTDMSTTSPSKSGDALTAIAAAPAKLQDVIHTTALPGSEHLEELQKHSKKSEKDKNKNVDRKKGAKHEKVPSKVKPTQPVTASPSPPQLVTLPANMAVKSSVTPATTQVPPTNAKQPVNPALKSIQPKPPVLGDASANVPNTKEKKNKSKKKSKDKDKEREKSASAKDKEIKDSSIVNNKQAVLPPPVPGVNLPKQQQQITPTAPVPQAVPNTAPVPQAVPKQLAHQPGTVSNVLTETNILHQALTASGIGPEDAERNSPSVQTNPGDVTKSDQSQKDQSKDVRPVFPNRPPMHSNMPEPPKLIPTSSVVNPGGRPVGAVQPHLPPHHVKPLQSVQDNAKIDKTGVPLPQMKHDVLPDSETSMQNLTPTDETRARSPAYSDISDANEETEVPAKPINECDPYSFPDTARNQAAKVGPSHDEHMHSKNLFTPLSTDVRTERLPEGIHKQDPIRTAPPHVQPLKPADIAGKEGSHTEGPDAKKPRKDTARLPATSEAGYRPPPSQAYPGHMPYTHAGFVMDPQYHMQLLKTDPHYRQQHEQFRQEQRHLQDKERIDRERQSTSDKPSPGKIPEGDRTKPRIKTEPITPPKRNLNEKPPQEGALSDRPPSADKLKRKQLDFQKSVAENVPPVSQDASAKRSSPEESPHKSFKYQHQREEEMRQYYIYQQKVQQQKYEEEQRQKSDENHASSDKLKENRTERRSTPSPQCNPPKNRSPRPPSVEERKLKQSPRSSPSPMGKDPKAAMLSNSSRKVLDYPAFLQHTPYGPMPVHQTPYGPIPIDPNHPAYQHTPIIYPAYLGHELRYPSSVVSPMWKSPEDKAHFEHERSRAISPHQGGSSSRGASPSEPPPKALDLLQQHASRYYSSHKHDRSRSPSEKSRPSSPQRRTASPRKSPEAGTSRESSHRSEGHMTQAMVHQHMHTHQHTHVGFPTVLPPYDPFAYSIKKRFKNSLIFKYSPVNRQLQQRRQFQRRTQSEEKICHRKDRW